MNRPDHPPVLSLLERIQQGDRDAVMEAYEVHFADLYRFVRLRVPQATLAEDIVSDVFVTLLECVGKPNAPRSHLRGWLFKVARTQLQAHLQSIGNARIALQWESLEEWMPAMIESNPEHLLGDVFDQQRLQHALNMLNSDHQEVLLLRFGQQLSLQETAETVGKSISAVKSIQFRALQTLRQIMTSEPKAEDASKSEDDPKADVQAGSKGGAS